MTDTPPPSTPPAPGVADQPGSAAASGHGLPGPWLVADIGGTNARFGWLASGAGPVEYVATIPAAGHAGPAEAAQDYLQQLAQRLGTGYRPPRAGALAVATAVGGDRVEFTNSGWAFSRHDTQRALGLDELLLLNDFEALAMSLPRRTPPSEGSDERPNTANEFTASARGPRCTARAASGASHALGRYRDGAIGARPLAARVAMAG